MCILTALSAIGSALSGGVTAAGASAGAAASGLSAVGTGLAVAGSLYQGYAANQTAKSQAAAIERQAKAERQINAVQEQRTRRQFMSQIRQQSAELVSRGVSLDSPTAVLLGQTAAQEMSFAAQSVRSEGRARQIELSNEARLARARGTQGLLNGTFSAAGSLLSGAPKIWPEFAV